MSVVLCLPAHLCVSTAASRGQAPQGDASKAFHRRGVTHPSRATRGHLAETHRDPLAEDHQDPLEDNHQVDHPEADPLAEEDPLDRADPAEALLEDPLGTPTTHQGTATRMPPGGGFSTSAGGSSPSSAR